MVIFEGVTAGGGAAGSVVRDACAGGVAVGSGLLGAARIRELLAELGVRPTKQLGQNFVVDQNTVRKIVRTAGVAAGDLVLEVGPGLGSLTLGLLEAGARVLAVEIDGRFAARLPVTVCERLGSGVADRLRVLEGDAVRLSAVDVRRWLDSFGVGETEGVGEVAGAGRATGAGAGAGARVFLVANLPYNVAVPILVRVFEVIPDLAGAVVMVQAEVGRRIAASAGSREYAAASVKLSWRGGWSVAGLISRRAFWPVPGVDSVLVRYVPHAGGGVVFADGVDELLLREKTFAVATLAFRQRRKMLRQSLKGVFGDGQSLAGVFARAGVDPCLRAEQLGVAEFRGLAFAMLVAEGVLAGGGSAVGQGAAGQNGVGV